MSSAEREPSRRRRLSSIFGSKRDSSRLPQDQLAPNNGSLGHRSSNADTNDSAYASSAGAPSQSRIDLTPIENNGQINGVSSDRNLAVNKKTGDVVDEGSGQVVSVTTTTTTTTTIKPNGKQEQQVEVSSQPVVPQPQQQDATEMPAEPVRRHQPTASTSSAAPTVPDSPAVPSRSPYRVSREGLPEDAPVTPVEPLPQHERVGSPTSANAPNFSRPSRSSDGVGGALSNLKAAAKGIHGVGETLRGTFNNEIDRGFSGGDAERAAAAQAKNQAVIEKGRRQMEGVQRNSAVSPTAPQAQYNAPVAAPTTQSTGFPSSHQPGQSASGQAHEMLAQPDSQSSTAHLPPTSTPAPQPTSAPTQATPAPTTTSPGLMRYHETPVQSAAVATAPTSGLASAEQAGRRSSSARRSPFPSFRRKQEYVPPTGTAVTESEAEAAQQAAVQQAKSKPSGRFSKLLKKRPSQAV